MIIRNVPERVDMMLLPMNNRNNNDDNHFLSLSVTAAVTI